jgi:hypothetical protein
MKILNKTSYTTTILEIEHNNEVYTIRHAEDHDGYFVNEWEILNEDGDLIDDVLANAACEDLYDTLTFFASEHINGTNKSLIEASSITTNVYSPDAQKVEWASILANELSGEQLDYQEFVEYIEGYYENPEEYNIHPDSSYWSAIVSAWHNTEEMYELYLSQFKK